MTTAAEDEKDRMGRAQALSGGIWKATSWLLTLLGGGAFFTIGLRIQNPNQGFVWSAVYALLAIVVGGLAYLLINVITTSRIRKAEEAAQHRGIYGVIVIAGLVQLLAIGAAPVLQGVAVYQTLQANDPRTQADLALSQRLTAYSADASELPLVVAYCKQHDTDAQVSDLFLKDCLSFLQATPPTPSQAGSLAPSLNRK